MNNGVCLSLPLATRCFGVTTLQALGLLIPPCIEALCLSILLWSQRGRASKPWFLLSDTWLFALLNIAEFVPRLNIDFFPSLLAFEVYDRILAAASAVPILLFMIFLLSYAKRDLLPILPIRYRSSLTLILLLCIPLVTISTDIAALLGFSYKTSPNGSSYRFQPDLTNDQARVIWSLLNSIALAVFTIYQGSAFFLTGFRLSRHFFMERDESLSRRPNNDAMTINGTGWLAAGIKLSAIETLLAFIPNGWELVFARRLCRLLGRIFLLVGLLKGVDQLDGFTLFRAASMDSIEGLPPRRIPLMDSVRDRVNSPPLSTFGRQSPTARGLQDAAKVKPLLPPSALGKVDTRTSAGGHEGKRVPTPQPIVVSAEDGDVLTDFVPLARPRPARVLPRPDDQARVTLHYDGLRAPTLVLRFSALHIPSPGTVLATLRNVTPTISEPPSPVESGKKEVLKRKAMSAYIPNPFDDADTQSLRPLRPRRASTQVRRRRDEGSVATVGTAAFDPIAEVRALANRFPNPPDVPTGADGPESQNGHGEPSPGLERSSSSGHSKQSSTRSNSTRRKPAPVPSPGLLAQPVTMPPSARPPMPRTSMEDQQKSQVRQKSRKNYIQPSTGAALRSKNSTSAASISTAPQTMGTSMAPSTPQTGMSFRDAIDSVYDPEYVVSLPEGRPMGRLADRAIKMEAYLDKEKEKMGIAAPSTVTAAPRTLESRKIWEQEQHQVPSPGMVAHRRPQGDVNTEYPWAQKEDPVTGANADLEAAWKTATTTARTHDGAEHAGGEDHMVGQVKSLSRVTSRRQPVVRPVVHSVLSVSLEPHEESAGDEVSIGDQWSPVDPYAQVIPQEMQAVSVPASEEPDSPLDRWEPSPYTYIRP